MINSLVRLVRGFFNASDIEAAAPVEVTIIEPTAEEMEEGLAEVNECLPFWRQSPALLVIKPDLGLIVSVSDSGYDETGFNLQLAVDEVLIAPPDFKDTEMEIGCTWNQPYVSLSKALISAPYSFYLHFGREGVARVRELNASSFTSEEEAYPPEALLSRFRRCFREEPVPRAE